MGMVTHILINNDRFQDIEADPHEFVRSILAEMSQGGVTRLDAGRSRGVGWCAPAHHSSYSVAYRNDHTMLEEIPSAT